MKELRSAGQRLALVLMSTLTWACAPARTAPSAGVAPSPASAPSASEVAPTAPQNTALGETVEADELVATTLALVSRVRGLPVKAKVPGRRLDRAALRAEVERMMDDETPPEAVAGNGELLFALDTVPWDFDFKAAMTELYAGELAGFYDPKVKSMVLASDLSGDSARVTLYHELVHALQDQNFDLTGATDWKEDASDELGALHALLEGDATNAMMDVLAAAQGGEPRQIAPELLEAEGVLLQASPRLGLVPPILKRSLIVPYVDGLAFVEKLRARGGFSAVDDALRARPGSTEQVLHLEKYLAKEPVVALPPIPAPPEFATASYRDVVGEQGLRLVFEEAMPARLARRAASDWGGDRVALFSSGDRRVLRWHLVFDNEAAAERGLVALARGALRPELGLAMTAEAWATRAAGDAQAAARIGQVGRLCQSRPQRGPFALVRHGRHIGVTLGPYDRGRTAVRGEDNCPLALAWAEALAHG